VKGANIGVAVVRPAGWEDRRYGLFLPLPRRPSRANPAISIRGYGARGGLGLTIMDELMDSVVVEPFEDGTTVTMHRRLGLR
jgi:anti-sigma regulatory factor (Ser/Thr protein kinase)